MANEHLSGTWQKERSFSPAVITNRASRIVWVAGHGGLFDEKHEMIKADFDRQVRQAFANVAATLKQAGATLADIVSMTVHIGDARHGDRFVELRKEFFPDGRFPASTLITVAGFAKPEMMVEITPVAVVDG
jgi:enamine deaminase RidA (YjgF/YER057c/UK114 family)